MRQGTGFSLQEKEEEITTGLCANEFCQKRFIVSSPHISVIDTTDYKSSKEMNLTTFSHSQQFCSYRCKYIWMKNQ